MMNTTFSMGDGSPGRSGTGRAGASARGRALASAASRPFIVRRLFAATAAVYAARPAESGISITWTVPRCAKTYRLRRGPPALPSPEPTPNSVPTAMRFPSALTSIDDGYQAVGRRPSNAALALSWLTAYTATAFAPPRVTYNRSPDGDRATAVGATPAVRSRNGIT